MNNDPWICTHTGRHFHFLDPNPDMIHVEDIAHALSNLCRWSGHTNRFYSVAEHSVHVSHEVPADLALVGLLHDATEAYVVDIASPLKTLLPDYRAIEQRVWQVIATKFDLPSTMPDLVKKADMALLKTEAAVLMSPYCFDDLNLAGELSAAKLSCWDPSRAKFHFMTRFYQLTGIG